jgi:D-alanine-D-alanine ligase-like ATP-grasp enzyme
MGTGMKAPPGSFESLIGDALEEVQHLPPRAHSFNHRADSGKRSLDAELLSRDARRMGLESLMLSDDSQVIFDGDHRVGFFQNMAWRLTALDRLITHDKALTKRVLEDNGIPVAHGTVVESLDEAVDCFKELGAPVVVKPITGSGGKGITVDVATEPELAAAVAGALARRGRALIEECVTSLDLRVMVCAGTATAAMLRVPAHVTGDGEATVAELVARKNQLRKANPYLAHSPLRLSPDVVDRLGRRGLSEQSVIPAGERFFLHYKANLSAGGESYDVTRLVHPDVLRVAERAARCFGSAGHAGVDILVEHFDRSTDGQRCIVCEVNCNNDMPMHKFPLFGDPVPAALHELEGYFGPRRRTALRRVVGALRADPSERPGVRPTAGYGPHRPPTTLESVWDWPGISQAIAEHVEHPDGKAFRTVREFDASVLVDSLSSVGWTDGRSRGRLIQATDGQREVEVVVERSGTSVFAKAMSRRRLALATLLGASGIPACRVARFRPSEWEDLLRFYRTSPAPWNLWAAGRGGTAQTRHAVTGEPSLRRAWERRASDANSLLLEQAARFMSVTLLLIGNNAETTVITIPAYVEGDGTSSITDLVSRRAGIRSRHPYLRHYLGRAAATRPARYVDDPELVLAEGQRLFTGRSPYLSAGADTVGYPSCPVPALAEVACRVREAVGGPPILAVTFAARPPDEQSGQPHWAVAEIDPDPVLALFAWPWRGHAPGAALYHAVARKLLRGQRYEFAQS